MHVLTQWKISVVVIFCFLNYYYHSSIDFHRMAKKKIEVQCHDAFHDTTKANKFYKSLLWLIVILRCFFLSMDLCIKKPPQSEDSLHFCYLYPPFFSCKLKKKSLLVFVLLSHSLFWTLWGHVWTKRNICTRYSRTLLIFVYALKECGAVAWLYPVSCI